MSHTSSSSRGSSGFTLLFIVFLVLKLTDTIDWSWWWVTLPLWGPFLVALPFLIALGVFWLVKR